MLTLMHCQQFSCARQQQQQSTKDKMQMHLKIIMCTTSTRNQYREQWCKHGNIHAKHENAI